jgi:exonuclease VII small subunit
MAKNRFEEHLARLDSIVTQLQGGCAHAPFQLYERAIEAVRVCVEELDLARAPLEGLREECTPGPDADSFGLGRSPGVREISATSSSVRYQQPYIE